MSENANERTEAEQRAYEFLIDSCDVERLAIEYYRLTTERPRKGRPLKAIYADKDLVLKAIKKEGKRLHHSL